jgi:hypothetical protein
MSYVHSPFHGLQKNIHLDYKNNFDIIQQLNTEQITEFIKSYRWKWKAPPSDVQLKNLVPTQSFDEMRQKLERDRNRPLGQNREALMMMTEECTR